MTYSLVTGLFMRYYIWAMLCINLYRLTQFTDDCKISHNLVAQGKSMISKTYPREKIDHMIGKDKNYK